MAPCQAGRGGSRLLATGTYGHGIRELLIAKADVHIAESSRPQAAGQAAVGSSWGRRRRRIGAVACGCVCQDAYLYLPRM